MGTRGFWKFKHQDRQRCELALALALALRLRCAAPPPSFTYTILRTVYQLALLTGRCRNGNDLLQLCCPLGPCCTVPEPASHRLLETASTRSYTRLIYKKRNDNSHLTCHADLLPASCSSFNHASFAYLCRQSLEHRIAEKSLIHWSRGTLSFVSRARSFLANAGGHSQPRHKTSQPSIFLSPSPLCH
ncbi:uncharacterized protein K444DRAFT_314867 [Hyaloscypha bicolor E]|uniref:Secreted protein n=1 Tax=Hyaloscypha bicolor E TaxID=1095630 RepID=A0A2J6TMA1_9HELO|nr:uncharacterized protein K444DRAFT_314867 [Hyaloscypha bicolor E]PMD64102.1 hypothetical protein K444DRAFT_314867 [Hyaloscypha bicolor E]